MVARHRPTRRENGKGLYCIPCQSVAGKSTAEPLRLTMMPEWPWKDVHIDLCGPFPSGESLLV